jgi:hypothetical protein
MGVIIEDFCICARCRAPWDHSTQYQLSIIIIIEEERKYAQKHIAGEI